MFKLIFLLKITKLIDKLVGRVLKLLRDTTCKCDAWRNLRIILYTRQWRLRATTIRYIGASHECGLHGGGTPQPITVVTTRSMSMQQPIIAPILNAALCGTPTRCDMISLVYRAPPDVGHIHD